MKDNRFYVPRYTKEPRGRRRNIGYNYVSTAEDYIEKLEAKVEKGIRINRLTSY